MVLLISEEKFQIFFQQSSSMPPAPNQQSQTPLVAAVNAVLLNGDSQGNTSDRMSSQGIMPSCTQWGPTPKQHSPHPAPNHAPSNLISPITINSSISNLPVPNSVPLSPQMHSPQMIPVSPGIQQMHHSLDHSHYQRPSPYPHPMTALRSSPQYQQPVRQLTSRTVSLFDNLQGYVRKINFCST